MLPKPQLSQGPSRASTSYGRTAHAVFLSPLNLCVRVCALYPPRVSLAAFGASARRSSPTVDRRGKIQQAGPRPLAFTWSGANACLSSHSSLRNEVVPESAAAVEDPLDPDAGQLALVFDGEGDDGVREGAGKRRPCAWLLRYAGRSISCPAGRRIRTQPSQEHPRNSQAEIPVRSSIGR